MRNSGLSDLPTTYLGAAVGLGVLEGIARNVVRSRFRDQLDGLNDSRHDFVLNTRIFSFGVLSDGDNVDILVRSLVAFNGTARSHVGIKVEFLTQSQIQGAMTLSDRSGQGTFQADLVLVDGVDGSLRDAETAVGTADLARKREIYDY